MAHATEQMLSEEPAQGGRPAGTEADQRYHSLDVLRASLMSLGIVFHAGVFYATIPGLGGRWPTSDLLAYVVLGIHGFHMALFFVLAGFFAALLYGRRTPSRFAANRLLHIGLPLFVGWLLFSSIAFAATTFSIGASFVGIDQAWDVTWQWAKEGEFFGRDQLAHLWFLYYLLYFYAALLVLAPLFKRVPAARLLEGSNLARRLLRSHWRLPILAALTLGLFHSRGLAATDTPSSFVPDAEFLAFYGAFFGFGVVLFHLRDVLDTFRNRAWLQVSAGLVLMVVFKLTLVQWLSGADNAQLWHALTTVVNAALVWCLMFGLTGVFLTYLNRPVPVIRYLVDASYWFYLVHLPFGFWFPGLLSGETLAPELKFAVTLGAMLCFCFVTYELFVRWTYIGTVLQGRRYPSIFRLRRRAMETPEPVTAPGTT